MKQFNYNSLSARFYRWFYNQSYMPNNICPYFWKLVLAVVFCIPYGIYLLPAMFKKDTYCRNEEAKEFWAVLFWWSFTILGIGVLLFMMSVPILWLFGINVSNSEHNQIQEVIIGTAIWTALIIILIARYIHVYKHNKRYKESFTRPKRGPSVIGTWISDFYHKRCSIITWSNPNTQENGTDN